jgi:hypothetical protein
MAYVPYLPAWGIVQIETMRPATGIVILCVLTLALKGNRNTTCFHSATGVRFSWFQKVKVAYVFTMLYVCLCIPHLLSNS